MHFFFDMFGINANTSIQYICMKIHLYRVCTYAYVRTYTNTYAHTYIKYIHGCSRHIETLALVLNSTSEHLES